MPPTSPAVPPLRAGVIGLGWPGRTHLEAYLAHDVQVVAIADSDADRLEAVGDKHAIQHRYASADKLLARDDLDIVSICTPNYLHAPAAIAALKSGKHVLCEKPLARNTQEAQAIVEAAIAHDRIVHVAFNRRAREDVDVLKRHMDAGGLGRVYHAKAFWMRRSGIPGGPGSWFFRRELAGGGPLIDLGVHVLDMALFLLGEPQVTTISAATYAELGPRGRGAWGGQPFTDAEHFDVEDLATAFIRLAMPDRGVALRPERSAPSVGLSGATLLLEASWAVYGSAGDDFGVTLYGTEGGAEIYVKDYGTRDTLTLFSDTGGAPSVIRPRVSKDGGHMIVVRNFLEAIRSGDWSQHRGYDGLQRTRIIDACYESARLRREITLEPLPALKNI